MAFLIRRRTTSLILACWVVTEALGTPPENEAPEYQVKAAFVYNFAKFVIWPDEETGGQGKEFVLGILGDDPFGEFIDQVVSGKLLRGRRIEVRRMRKLAGPPGCHIVFVSRSEREKLKSILLDLEHSPVLTVSDLEDFSKNGGMITLLLKHGRVRFAINASAVERAGLRMSSRLLALARIVGEDR